MSGSISFLLKTWNNALFEYHRLFSLCQISKPMYIRDCMEGLIENKDREHMEIYLNSVAELIEKDAFAAKEVRKACYTCNQRLAAFYVTNFL